jgi:hypothetical protein
VYEG